MQKSPDCRVNSYQILVYDAYKRDQFKLGSIWKIILVIKFNGYDYILGIKVSAYNS